MTSGIGYKILSSIINLVITLLTDCIGLIHNTRSRYTLAMDNRPAFNSNLRLFTSSTKFRTHWWPLNMLWFICLIRSYSSTSLSSLTNWSPTYIETSVPEADHFSPSPVTVDSPAILLLGLGLLGQTASAIWAYLTVPLMSSPSNPLDLARVCATKEWFTRRPDRALLRAHNNSARQQVLQPLQTVRYNPGSPPAGPPAALSATASTTSVSSSSSSFSGHCHYRHNPLEQLHERPQIFH